MSKTLSIGDRLIGPEHLVFIIAEGGVNHNGDMELAKKLVRKAKECGADCVKFQTFKAERVASEKAPKANYQLQNTNPEESQIDMLKKLELPPEGYKELIRYCKEQDIIFLSTPYNMEDVDLLSTLGVPAFKLASIHVAEPYFVKYTAKKGKPIILSTGMATLAEVDEALRTIREAGNENAILLQCTTNYPSRVEDANLLAMVTMRDVFDVLVGYSDHTQDDTACIASVALGAKVIEKHFTLDKKLPGPDHLSSADPSEFTRLVRNIRNAEKALGSSIKYPSEIEKKNAVGMRRSIVARHSISKGTVITEEMLTFKRPGNGLPPSHMPEIVGQVTKQLIKEDTLIEMSDLENYQP